MDADDPLMEGRLRVLVPEVLGSDAVWARPSVPPGGMSRPVPGDDVWVSFERGDTDYAVWEPSVSDDRNEDATTGYIGKYRAIVVDDADPLQQGRLQVSIPEVTGDSCPWATPGLFLGPDDPVPQVGADVWVEFEQGDPLYPVWVGTP
jgi:Type VI secretion system/phage-baseplate injector OB domain